MGAFGKYTLIILLAICNGAFWMYDLAISRVFDLYMIKLHPKIKRIMK